MKWEQCCYPVSKKAWEELLKFCQNNEWSTRWGVSKGDGFTATQQQQLHGLLIGMPFHICHWETFVTHERRACMQQSSLSRRQAASLQPRWATVACSPWHSRPKHTFSQLEVMAGISSMGSSLIHTSRRSGLFSNRYQPIFFKRVGVCYLTDFSGDIS